MSHITVEELILDKSKDFNQPKCLVSNIVVIIKSANSNHQQRSYKGKLNYASD